MLVRHPFSQTPLGSCILEMFFVFPQLHVTYSLFLNLHKITMFSVSFTRFISLLRIVLRGTYFLEVATAMVYMLLMLPPTSPLLLLRSKSSAASVCLHHYGTLVLVTQHLPLFAMSS